MVSWGWGGIGGLEWGDGGMGGWEDGGMGGWGEIVSQKAGGWKALTHTRTLTSIHTHTSKYTGSMCVSAHTIQAER